MFNLLPSDRILTVTIRNRTTVVYQGPVRALTSVNQRGTFDVLPEHANFISIIKEYLILTKPDGTSQQFKITRGVLKVEGSNASIYLGIAPEQHTNVAVNKSM